MKRVDRISSSRTNVAPNTLAGIDKQRKQRRFDMYRTTGAKERLVGYQRRALSIQEIYLSECRRYRLTPVEETADRLPDEPHSVLVEDIDLDDIVLTNAVRPLLDVFHAGRCLHTVSFRNCALSADDLLSIIGIATTHPAIHELHLSGNPVPPKDVQPVADAIMRAVVTNPRLMDLTAAPEVLDAAPGSLALWHEWNASGRTIDRLDCVELRRDLIKVAKGIPRRGLPLASLLLWTYEALAAANAHPLLTDAEVASIAIRHAPAYSLVDGQRLSAGLLPPAAAEMFDAATARASPQHPQQAAGLSSLTLSVGAHIAGRGGRGARRGSALIGLVAAGSRRRSVLVSPAEAAAATAAAAALVRRPDAVPPPAPAAAAASTAVASARSSQDNPSAAITRRARVADAAEAPAGGGPAAAPDAQRTPPVTRQPHAAPWAASWAASDGGDASPHSDPDAAAARPRFMRRQSVFTDVTISGMAPDPRSAPRARDAAPVDVAAVHARLARAVVMSGRTARLMRAACDDLRDHVAAVEAAAGADAGPFGGTATTPSGTTLRGVAVPIVSVPMAATGVPEPRLAEATEYILTSIDPARPDVRRMSCLQRVLTRVLRGVVPWPYDPLLCAAVVGRPLPPDAIAALAAAVTAPNAQPDGSLPPISRSARAAAVAAGKDTAQGGSAAGARTGGPGRGGGRGGRGGGASAPRVTEDDTAAAEAAAVAAAAAAPLTRRANALRDLFANVVHTARARARPSSSATAVSAMPSVAPTAGGGSDVGGYTGVVRTTLATCATMEELMYVLYPCATPAEIASAIAAHGRQQMVWGSMPLEVLIRAFRDADKDGGGTLDLQELQDAFGADSAVVQAAKDATYVRVGPHASDDDVELSFDDFIGIIMAVS